MPKNRKKWEEYISSGSTSSRLLFNKSDSIFSTAPTLSREQAQKFLEKLSRSEAHTTYLTSLFYFTQPLLKAFFSEQLKNLKRSLNKGTHLENKTAKDSIKGSIAWKETHRERTRKNNRHIYVCRNSKSTNDIPENKLLKFFLQESFLTINEIIKIGGTESIPREILEIRHIIEQTLKDQNIRSISPAYRINSIMTKRARRSKKAGYTNLSLLYQKFRDAIKAQKSDAVYDLISNGWFEPINNDDLFEIYVLVLILDILHTELGPPTSYGLVARNRKEVAKFHCLETGIRASVYYDQSPDGIFKMTSNYSKILQKYDGISGNPRRPDITICFIYPDGQKRILLVEAKKTDSSSYKNESIYKAIAYAKDFSYLWHKLPKQQPKVLLAFPESGVTPYAPESETAEVELVSTNETSRMQNIVRSTFLNWPFSNET